MADSILIRCSRAVDMPKPPAPHVETRSCSGCGAAIWYDTSIEPELARDHPDHEIVLRCLQCGIDGLDSQRSPNLPLPSGNVENLRKRGFTNERIAATIACAELIDADSTFDETQREIINNGPKAETFRVLYKQYLAALHGLDRRN